MDRAPVHEKSVRFARSMDRASSFPPVPLSSSSPASIPPPAALLRCPCPSTQTPAPSDGSVFSGDHPPKHRRPLLHETPSAPVIFFSASGATPAHSHLASELFPLCLFPVSTIFFSISGCHHLPHFRRPPRSTAAAPSAIIPFRLHLQLISIVSGLYPTAVQCHPLLDHRPIILFPTSGHFIAFSAFLPAPLLHRFPSHLRRHHLPQVRRAPFSLPPIFNAAASMRKSFSCFPVHAVFPATSSTNSGS